MKTSPRIAFIDLDDTLLAHDKTISPENRAALAKLRDAKIEPVVASGRHHNNIIAIKGIGELDWVLSSNGSQVRHGRTGEVLSSLTMTPESVTKICRLGRERGMTLIAYHREGAYMEQSSHWTDFYTRQAGWAPKLVNFTDLDPSEFQKILWSTEPATMDETASSMRQTHADEYEMVSSAPELLEFLVLGANKAAGAKALCKWMGIEQKQTLAFGDGNNDVELLSWAGLSVAMNHGRESARKAASHVSPAGPPETALARAINLALEAM